MASNAAVHTARNVFLLIVKAYKDRCSCLKFTVSHSSQRVEKCFSKGKAYTISLFEM